MTEIDYRDYHRLIASISHKHLRRAAARGCFVEMDDLIQEGGFAFMAARDKFDPEYGVKFSTYLYTAVDRRLSRYCDNEWHRSKNVSMDEPRSSGDSVGEMTLHDVIKSEGESVIERLERMADARDRIMAMSDDTKLVVALLTDPGNALTSEVMRLKAFSERSAKMGKASPNVKLSVDLICDLLGFNQPRRRKLKMELKMLERGDE